MTRTQEITFEKAEKAFNKVRQELAEVGLLEEGIYLDEIDMVQSGLNFKDAEGMVYDNRVPLFSFLIGFRSGTIYLPRNLAEKCSSGTGVLDAIRHEFAHCWAWLDREFVDGDWLKQAFGEGYEDILASASEVYKRTEAMDKEDPGSGEKYFARNGFRDEFCSPYAMSAVKEDFAETFMYFLKYRRSLERFKNRKGVYRKLKAVEAAVRRKASELGLK